MKVVTILGLVKEGEKIPIYRYGDRLKDSYSLKRERYVNMLPLLIDNFGVQDVVPIFTLPAKDVQTKVLEKELQNKHNEIFKDKNFIDDENDFYSILRIINDVTSGNEEYIIDLTHGFRHIPILATISLISQSLNNTDKSSIYFLQKK